MSPDLENSNKSLSKEGLNFIKNWESLSLTPYDDGAGYQTIGYGHKMSDEEIASVESITQEEAEALLSVDVRSAENGVNQLVKVPLAQHQFDALVSFCFNCGVGNFGSSTLLKLLNKGYYGTVSEQMARWVHSGGKKMKGLVRRREAEGRFFEGDYVSK